jgi:predicted acetyltransferase
MSGVDITVARADQRDVLANLIQFYTHDFTEIWAGLPRGELEEDGRFAPYPPLDSYWHETGRIPLLIRKDGKLAGFALLNELGHGGSPVEHNMAEFFVVRKHRRGGIGTAAVHAIFDRYSGRWEVAVVRANVGALAFWGRAIASYPGVRALEKLDLQTEAWDGPVFCFRIES